MTNQSSTLVTAEESLLLGASRMQKYQDAIREATDICLSADDKVYIIGLGVPDPKGVFGTTIGLKEKFGSQRVMDMPVAENGMTGIAIGSALTGMRPIIVHQRLDFAMLAVEQIVNQAANWHYMYGGTSHMPITIRLIVGRGWGQGPQHSQSLHAWFAHIPGLKVVMPATAFDAKGLLIASVEDNNPVIFIEHRWLHNIEGPVPEKAYKLPFGKARILRPGKDVTIVGVSYMSLEAVRAADSLASHHGIDAEVIDLRSIRPLDSQTILDSVAKTGRLVVADTSWTSFGVGAEIVSKVCEEALDKLKAPPQRLGNAECPSPSTPALAQYFYTQSQDIEEKVLSLFGRQNDLPKAKHSKETPLDVPDASFKGPF